MSTHFKLPIVSKDDPIYRAHQDDKKKWYVHGPGGAEFDYYGGTLFPESRFDSFSDAEKAAALINRIYAEGYAQAQLDIRLALGL